MLVQVRTAPKHRSTHIPNYQSTERTAPPSSAHVQLDDVPRTPIQPSVEGKFHQHDGVVTMMMFYRCRTSPKHRNDMTEVEYGGGGHRTWLRNDHEDQLVCSRVPPAPVYKGAKGRGRPAKEGAPRGSPTPTGSRTPFFPSWIRRRGKRRKSERKVGAPPPFPCPIQTRKGRGARPPLASFPLLP